MLPFLGRVSEHKKRHKKHEGPTRTGRSNVLFGIVGIMRHAWKKAKLNKSARQRSCVADGDV